MKDVKQLVRLLVDVVLGLIVLLVPLGVITAAGVYYFAYSGITLVVFTLLLYGSLLIGFFYLPFLTVMLVEFVRLFRMHRFLGGLFMLFVQATTKNGSILVQRLNQNYEWCPIEQDKDGGLFARTRDGERITVDASLDEFYTYKGRPLGFTVEISEGVFSDVLLPQNDEDSDGVEGEFVIDPSDRRSSKGLLSYNPFPNTDGLFASVGKVHERLRGTNGVGLLLQGKEQALMDKGGRQELNRNYYYLSVVFLAVLGVFTGLFITGML